eukprot:gene17950-24353_t
MAIGLRYILLVLALTGVRCAEVVRLEQNRTWINPFRPNISEAPPFFPDPTEMPKPFTQCKAPPIPAVNVTFYTDNQYSVIDETLYNLNVAAVLAVTDLADGLSDLSAAYWGSRPLRPEIAECALEWLNIWAKKGAMLGSANRQGQYTIKFRLAQISIAYLHFQSEPSLDPGTVQFVEAWLVKIGQLVGCPC